MQDFAEEKNLMHATFIKDLIQKILSHHDFDPDEEDHDMHEELISTKRNVTIEEGDKGGKS